MIKGFNTLRYILEQSNGDFEQALNDLKNLISSYNSASPEEKKLIGEKPNTGLGKDFWDSTESILSDIQNMDPYSDKNTKFMQSRGDEFSEAMYNIKMIVKKYPEIYNASPAKDILDAVASEEIPQKTEPSTTPSTATPTTTPAPATGEKKPEEVYAKGYTGVSIVDFLDQSGKPSDMESRRKLAVEKGIVSKPEDYKGTAEQNTQLLNKLRGGPATSTTTPTTDQKQTPTTSMKDVPKIKFGDMQFPPYVDMGAGRYVLATPEQVADPNLQLYIQNPRKGQGEYNKANFVKVRREGGGKEIRRQSQFGGALGSASNLLGDIGTSLAKPFRK